MPLSPSYCQIEAPATIDQITVSHDMIRPKLTLEWSGISLINKITNQTLSVPKIYNFSMISASRIRDILNKTYCAYVFIQLDDVRIPFQSLTNI